MLFTNGSLATVSSAARWQEKFYRPAGDVVKTKRSCRDIDSTDHSDSFHQLITRRINSTA